VAGLFFTEEENHMKKDEEGPRQFGTPAARSLLFFCCRRGWTTLGPWHPATTNNNTNQPTATTTS